jgi:glyoxylase-like metal-dependent hydrolase (beta-lactamase superfamily II)
MQTAIAVLVVVAAQAATATAPNSVPPPAELAPGVHLLPGAMHPGRGPDGNTVIFDAPEGLIVIDTGRHAWHSDGILAFAAKRERPVAAIVNTHWHLDHSSGNGRIKAAWPRAALYTTRAVDRALADGGFLARNLDSARPMLDDPKVDAVEKEEVRIFVATMDERAILRPDVVVAKSGDLAIAGRPFAAHVTDRAVTDADVWLYDGASGIAVLGDLVTLPAPFFETACPAQWRASLDEVWATPFGIAIPGHGRPMDRVAFDTYRRAFNGFMDCVEGGTAAAQCAASWAEGVAPLLGGDDRMRRMALEYAQYYAGMLRENGGKSAECLVAAPR